MARFVTFPGISGSYASTDDVNILDADTSHLFQSIGDWSAFTGTPPIEAVADPQATFSGMALKLATITLGSPATRIRTNSGLSGFPVQENTAYTISYLFWSNAASSGLGAGSQIHWYDAGGGFITNSNKTVGNFAEASQLGFHTATSPPLAAFALIQVAQDGNVVDTLGELFWANFMFTEGTSTTFAPSLKIVGDLEAEIEVTFTVGGVAQALVTRRGGGGFRAFNWFVNASDLLRFGISVDGTAESFQNSSLSISSNDQHVYKVTYQAADGRVDFFQDGAPFGNFGSVTSGGAFPAAKSFEVGAYDEGTTSPLPGDVYAGSLRDGIDGPIVAVFDPDDITI